MVNRLALLISLLLCLVASSVAAKPTVVDIDDLRSNDQQRQAALIITQVMEKFHYRKPRLDDEMSSAVLDRYLESLDANRSFFSARDVAAFERYRLTLDDSLRTGKLEEDEWPRLTSAVSILAEAQLHIDDTASLTPTEIRARSRRLMREHGQLGLIVIDYLQLMQVPGHKENRTGEISEISRSLKALAKELNVPVIALSQLNRSLEQRPNKRPVMSDLRESGAIEQDADVIMFIYRDEVYDEDSPDKGTAEIIIGKQRNGPIGMRRLTFLGQHTRFENFTAVDSYSDEGYA